ncbi:tryptophan aminotransferase [Cryptococcus wingfieldii CBS 7118]|uniref:Tryptophan aminotransferase n=1 Tax=Cryptococcus wingfieldii CBS 7118 TaxID=1295528 RepID=A0A1E3JZ95_9TREE|nr:tryptophan aminotransferase [Cryptococcus wingfieldii CBS 7118]ODO06131.1 tryptophan aminotransferase [Cryptococcus wingfieldii CBS 7118]
MTTETVGLAPQPQPSILEEYSNGVAPKYNSHDHLSDRSKVTEVDGIRGLMSLEKDDVVSFYSAGRPNPVTFPFESITLNLKSPLGSTSTDIPPSVTIDGEDLNVALQYAPSAGLPKLTSWLSDLQSTVHKRDKSDFAISLGSGSQDLMYKGFLAVLNPGDPVLLETPIYSGVLPPMKFLHAEMIEIDVDEQGGSAVNLEKALSEWPKGKKMPKVLYSSPVGSNPSGCSAPRERKLEILKVCKKYGILIFEDDPYYYLAEKHVPSYFALETEVYPEGGHVVRFDSFSKLLSAGLRLGFVTGPKEITHAIDVITAGANLHTSGVSQAVALRLMQEWGLEGFLNHGRQVAHLYATRRAQFEASAHKYLDGLASWVSPVAGMFLWVDLSEAGIEDSYELIRHEALAKGVLGVPGVAFYPHNRKSPHVRLSFSIVDLEQDTDLGFQRLAEAIREKQAKLGIKA